MRKFTVLICIFLILSGLLIAYPEWFPFEEQKTLTVLVHIWLGLFFMVIFPMYAWDHIRVHRNRLKKLTWISISGGLQLLTGSGLILTGNLLLLYNSDTLSFPADMHEILTYVLAGTLILHSKVTR